ncbi:MAG: GNAT family N-acetyltransferase [Planctomycetota bacterium]|nr:MAG: GNAT family N-acetyltransferase [Planctomycetota bacterium]
MTSPVTNGAIAEPGSPPGHGSGGSFQVRTVGYDRLTPDEIAAWSDMQRGNPSLGSPYFRPEFTQAVADVRGDVEVAVLEQDGAVVGFLPFQRGRRNVGRPVAGLLSDFHGVIAVEGFVCSPVELVRGCGLSAWHFDDLLSEQTAFAPHAWRSFDSPYIDLPRGIDAYIEEQPNGRRIMSEYRQKKRKLAREVGEVRFETHVADSKVLSTFLQWKGAQFRESGLANIFDLEWVRNLLDRILEFSGESFAPMLSVAYAGDTIAAINFGMRSATVLHPWFPTYNAELSRYSTGTMHMIELMYAAEPLGIRRIDLGKGPEPYKRRLMNGARDVMEGCVELRPGVGQLRSAWRTTREAVRRSPLYRVARGPARLVKQIAKRKELE